VVAGVAPGLVAGAVLTGGLLTEVCVLVGGVLGDHGGTIPGGVQARSRPAGEYLVASTDARVRAAGQHESAPTRVEAW
jgi:hypothetical protein